MDRALGFFFTCLVIHLFNLLLNTSISYAVRGRNLYKPFHDLSWTEAEKTMAPHSSTLAWRIAGMEEPGRLPSVGLHRGWHNWRDLAAAAAARTIEMRLMKGGRREMATVCFFFARKSTWCKYLPGRGSGSRLEPKVDVSGEFNQKVTQGSEGLITLKGELSFKWKSRINNFHAQPYMK